MIGFVLPWWAKYVALALLVAAVWGHGWVKGNGHGTAKLSAYIGKQAEQAAITRGKRAAVTERVVTEYVKKSGETKTVIEYVDRKVIEYVAQNPTGLCIDPEWVRVHDAAAVNRVPPAPGKPDGPVRPSPANDRPDRRAGLGDGYLQLRAASSLR